MRQKENQWQRILFWLRMDRKWNSVLEFDPVFRVNDPILMNLSNSQMRWLFINADTDIFLDRNIFCHLPIYILKIRIHFILIVWIAHKTSAKEWICFTVSATNHKHSKRLRKKKCFCYCKIYYILTSKKEGFMIFTGIECELWSCIKLNRQIMWNDKWIWRYLLYIELSASGMRLNSMQKL